MPAGDVGALIRAMEQANVTPGPDYSTPRAGNIYSDNHQQRAGLVRTTGLPPITDAIHILSSGPTGTIIQRADDAPLFRFFRVVEGGRLTLEGLTLRGGRANIGDGGAVLNEGSVTLVNVAMIANATAVLGGAVRNHASLTAVDSSFTDNIAG